MSTAEIAAPFVATAKQNEAARMCNAPGVRVAVLDGAYRSAKTQAGARVLIEWAIRHPGTSLLVARATYRSLKDTTQRAILHGDGGLPPLLPPEVVDQYRASDEVVRLRNGSQILFRSLEEGQVEKLRGLTLGGVLVDQLEELDGGPAGELVYDTLIGRMSDPGGPRRLIAITNPAGLTHWVYRRLINPATRDRNVGHVHFRMVDNPHLPEDYVAEMLATRETRPHYFRSFVEGEWGAFAGMAFPEFSSSVHVVDPFRIPEVWERFESMDHGANNPTAWHAWAVDHDGNVVVFDTYYSSGLVSKHAPEIHRRRAGGPRTLNAWQQADRENRCFADPSISASHGLTNRWGRPASVMTEYRDHGLHLIGANNDRQAGYLRLLELLHVEPGRIPPAWANVPADLGGAPRLFVFSTCAEVIEQLKSAPIAEDGVNAGECVDPKWESAHGHATAALRYGAMSRPGPSPKPVIEDTYETPDEYRAFAWREKCRDEAERDRLEDEDDFSDPWDATFGM